jgi:hypothetical protein
MVPLWNPAASPYAEIVGTDAGAPALNPGYRIYAFLETQSLMALEGGMYKFI